MSTQTGKPARRYKLRVNFVGVDAYDNDGGVLPFRKLIYFANANDRVGDVRLGITALFSKLYPEDGQNHVILLRDSRMCDVSDEFLVSDVFDESTDVYAAMPGLTIPIQSFSSMTPNDSMLSPNDSTIGDYHVLSPVTRRRRYTLTSLQTAEVPPSPTQNDSASARSPPNRQGKTHLSPSLEYIPVQLPSQSSARDMAALLQQLPPLPPTGVESPSPANAAGQHVSAGTTATSTPVTTAATILAAAVADDACATTTATPDGSLVRPDTPAHTQAASIDLISSENESHDADSSDMDVDKATTANPAKTTPMDEQPIPPEEVLTAGTPTTETALKTTNDEHVESAAIAMAAMQAPSAKSETETETEASSSNSSDEANESDSDEEEDEASESDSDKEEDKDVAAQLKVARD
ncbi:hypothetical protein IWW38_004845, partial [Coemansia aciculifera]